MVQKREPFNGEDQGMETMTTSGENVSGSVAAFVTTGGQNINIIHGKQEGEVGGISLHL